jgi:hypothetical protein
MEIKHVLERVRVLVSLRQELPRHFSIVSIAGIIVPVI